MLKYMLSILLFFIPFMSQGAEFEAGKDYEIIKADHPSKGADQAVNVTEFFSFGCPWCYRIEPSLNQWVSQQGTKITFQKIPVVFNKNWEFYAKAFYTVHALSLNATLNPVLFKAILDDKLTLTNNQAMVDFLVKNGVDKTLAQSAFNDSPSIDMEVASGLALMTRYHINAVPAFVINHHYKTDLQMAKTKERLFAILDFLISQSS